MSRIGSIAFIFIFISKGLAAQELNIGIHANPIFTTPVLSGKSVRDKETHISAFKPGYSIGLNLNLKLKTMGFGLDANYLRKSVRVYRKIKGTDGQTAKYSVNTPGNSLEFPLLVNFLLDRHDEATTYNLYLVAGMAYEISMWDTAASFSTTGSGNSGYSIYATGSYGGAAVQHVVSPVIGIKINAILRNVGLVDYGVSWHLPLTVSGPYNASATLYNGGVMQYSYNSSIYASASYIDFKLCYYFYSLGKKMKRVRYRNV
jgi:hypothetical protein